MAKSSRGARALPSAAVEAIAALGRDLALARTRRRIPQRLMARRMMVSLDTLQRLERGEPGVGLGVLAGALWALGMTGRLSALAAPESDAVGVAEERRRTPRRVRAAPAALDF